MRTVDDLRAALRVLEQQTPDARTVLRHMTERTSADMARPRRRLNQRLIAAAAAAAAVIAVVVVAALVTGPPAHHRRTAPQDPLQSVPRYYMAFVPADVKSYAESGLINEDYAVVKDSITGRTLATVRPPRPYVTFTWVTGAEDDRTFVLGAQSTVASSQTTAGMFYYAVFNPADNAVTLRPLALPALLASNGLAGVALSPDGTKLAVASRNGPAQITVYSLPTGAARTWTANVTDFMEFAANIVDLLSWSSTGTLAFGWEGTGGSPSGEYLLNTNTPGGSLLADSRDALCLAQSAPSSLLSSSAYYGYLTIDGTKIVTPVARPIPVGQALPSCNATAQPGGAVPSPQAIPPATAALEEFSAATGQAVSIIDTSRSHGAEADTDVFWSNPSGSVLVVLGSIRSDPKAPRVVGVLSGGEFTPFPGASSPPLIPQLAF